MSRSDQLKGIARKGTGMHAKGRQKLDEQELYLMEAKTQRKHTAF